jgi:hypothetical protein
MGLCSSRSGLRPLSKGEIERRIERVLSDVLDVAEQPPRDDACAPRWISARELVRRVHPFLCLN